MEVLPGPLPDGRRSGGDEGLGSRLAQVHVRLMLTWLKNDWKTKGTHDFPLGDNNGFHKEFFQNICVFFFFAKRDETVKNSERIKKNA